MTPWPTRRLIPEPIDTVHGRSKAIQSLIGNPSLGEGPNREREIQKWRKRKTRSFNEIKTFKDIYDVKVVR